MNPNRRFLCFLLLWGVPLFAARANLGETIEQNVARYGKPVGYAEASAKTPFGNVVFRAGPYQMVLFILNNKEVGARVSKIDRSAFTDGEIQDIMVAETGDSKWTPAASSDPSLLEWSRADHATLMYDKDKHLVLITSDAMAQAVQAAHGP